MPLHRHLEVLAKHIKAGNMQSAQNLAATLLRQYSSKASQAKIKAVLAS